MSLTTLNQLTSDIFLSRDKIISYNEVINNYMKGLTMSGQNDVFNITIRKSSESRVIDICCQHFTDYSDIIIKRNGNDIRVTMIENGNSPSLNSTV